MRLITGDELGLLKEIVPELCRHREDVDAGPTTSSSSSSSIATEFAGIRLPAVQRLSSRADISGGFGSDNNSGIVSLASIPPPAPSSSESSCFNFAALRSNGIVETWPGTRRGKEQNNNDYSEATPASYVKVTHLSTRHIQILFSFQLFIIIFLQTVRASHRGRRIVPPLRQAVVRIGLHRGGGGTVEAAVFVCPEGDGDYV